MNPLRFQRHILCKLNFHRNVHNDDDDDAAAARESAKWFFKECFESHFFKNWANSRPLFVYFRPLYITIQIFKLKKAKRR